MCHLSLGNCTSRLASMLEDAHPLVPIMTEMRCKIWANLALYICVQTISGAASLRWGFHLIGYWRAVRFWAIFIILVIILCSACWRYTRKNIVKKKLFKKNKIVENIQFWRWKGMTSSVQFIYRWKLILLCFVVLIFWLIQKQSETQSSGIKLDIFSGKWITLVETINYGTSMQPTIVCQWLFTLQIQLREDRPWHYGVGPQWCLNGVMKDLLKACSPQLACIGVPHCGSEKHSDFVLNTCVRYKYLLKWQQFVFIYINHIPSTHCVLESNVSFSTVKARFTTFNF